MSKYQVYWRRTSKENWLRAGEPCTEERLLGDYRVNAESYHNSIRRATKITETDVRFETVTVIKEL